MTVGGALVRGRAARMALMRDEIAVTRVTARSYVPGSNAYAPTTTEVYSGIADVKPQDIGAVGVQAGDREVVLRQFDVAVPFAETADFRTDDAVTVTLSDDVSLAGRTLVVVGVQRGGRRTARHFTAEERQ